MFNNLLATIGKVMGFFKVPTKAGQGFLAFIEFFLTAGKFFWDLVVKIFTFGKQ
jgi:hypothetical protein